MAEEPQTFEIPSNNSLYSIEISKTKNEKEDSIIFKAFDKNYLSNILYENSFNLEKLISFSQLFKLCETLDDAYNIILKTFQNKEEVKVEKDGKLYLSIDFKLPNSKLEKIKIPLEKGKMPDSIIIEKICENLAQTQEKNRQLEEEVKLLKLESKKLNDQLYKKENLTLMDIISKKFTKSKYVLEKDLSSHLSDFGLKDDFKNEITDKFESNAKVIYDVKKDGDTLVGFMAKVFGRKNIASFHALHGRDRYLSVQLAYLNGKIDFVNNYFNFDKTDLFTYGNYQAYDGDFCFTSFKAQNSKLYVKIEFDCLYVIFYEGDNINFIIKIRDNFINNPILYLDEGDEKISQFFENNSEDKVAELFNISRTIEVNLTELIIYQVGDE